MMGLTGYIAAGGLLLTLVGSTGAFFAGRHVQHLSDEAGIAKQREQLEQNSRADERLLATSTSNLTGQIMAALNRGDRQAAPIIVDMNRGLQNSPLATDPDCRVPVDVLRGIAALHGSAERAADAADAAGTALTGGTQR